MNNFKEMFSALDEPQHMTSALFEPQLTKEHKGIKGALNEVPTLKKRKGENLGISFSLRSGSLKKSLIFI